MKVFTYKVRDLDGQLYERKIQAADLVKAKSYLKQRNVKPIDLKEEHETLWEKLNQPRSVSQDDVVAFTQLWAGCIRSGLTVKESLILLSKQVENKLLRKRLVEIISTIEDGTPTSDAFTKHVDVFPVFFPMLLKAGEVSGDIASVLEYIGNYLEKVNDLKKEIKGVITYPAIVSVVGILLIAVILVFVAPTFKAVFQSTGRTLPIPTQILFFLSDIFISNGKYIFVILLALIGFLYLSAKSKLGKYKLHHFYLQAPLFGKIIKEIVLLRFIKSFDILVNNNVNIIQSLAILEDGATNVVLKEVITEMRKDVSKGLPIAGALSSHKHIISPLVAYTVAMGEKSGNLGVSLTRIGNFIDKELGYSIKKVSNRLNPILTIFLGFVVMFIALAIYLPIFGMITSATAAGK